MRRRPEPRAPTDRDKARDLYDLHRFAATPFDGVLRGLSDLEQRLVADAKSGLNEPLAERLHRGDEVTGAIVLMGRADVSAQRPAGGRSRRASRRRRR